MGELATTEQTGALLRVAAILGWPPSRLEYEVHRRAEDPTASGIVDAHGSWKAVEHSVLGFESEWACHTAVSNTSAGPKFEGVVERDVQKWKSQSPELIDDDAEITVFECLTAVMQNGAVVSGPVTMQAYEQSREETEPRPGTVAAVVGDWETVLEWTGLHDDSAGTEYAYLAEIVQAAADTQGRLTPREYDQRRSDAGPKAETVMERFGASWSDIVGMVPGDHQFEFTVPECLDAVRRVADKLGHTPRKEEYGEQRRDQDPTAWYILSVHGFGWRDLLQEADLRIPDAWAIEYPEQECVAAVGRVAERLGRPPTVEEYDDQRRSGEPCAQTVTTRLGSWQTAKEKAVSEIDVPLRARRNQYTRDECFGALRRVAGAVGRVPTVREYTTHRREEEPSSATIANRFGSWEAAKAAVAEETGLPRSSIHHYSREECSRALRQVAEGLGRAPTMEEYNTRRGEDDPCAQTITTRVGSWQAAKTEIESE